MSVLLIITPAKYPDNFGQVDEKLHSDRRRIVNHVYAMSSILESEQFIDKCSELFMQRLKEYADQGVEVDLGEWLQIGLTSQQSTENLQDRHDYGSYIESLDTLLPPLVVSAVSPRYPQPFVLPAALLLPATRKTVGSLKHIANAARSCVAERMQQMAEGEENRRDLLDKLFTIHREKGEKSDFQIEDIEQEAYVAIFAGPDTTAIVLRSVFYYLMRTPSAYDCLFSELDAATASNSLSNPVRYAEAIKLPYLCACIKEAMRLHPSVGLTMPRIVPKGGEEICGHFIPAGYKVGMNGGVVHYYKAVFGEDAGEFNPGRWFKRDAAIMDKYMIQSGAGTRTCIGKNISLSEIHKLVPQFLRTFRIELADPSKEWKTSNIWFNKQTEVRVKVVVRG